MRFRLFALLIPVASLAGVNQHGNNAAVNLAMRSNIPPAAHMTEFNHAIAYVNKIKVGYNNFRRVFKLFTTDSLRRHTRSVQAVLGDSAQLPKRTEGRATGLQFFHKSTLKDSLYLQNPSAQRLTESEVYTAVSHLFSNQQDLLAEFGKLLFLCGDSFKRRARSTSVPSRSQCSAGV